MTDGTTLKPHRATLILILGILGIVCCFPCGIVAWVLGVQDLQAMERGEMDPSGRSTTNAGKICGIIGVCWNALVIVGYAIAFLFFGLAARH